MLKLQVGGVVNLYHIDITALLPGQQWDNAISRIRQNKSELLLVLERPDIPLHNNLSERDIREYVKRRKIRGSTRSENGRLCRDSFTSLKNTCRKLGISFSQYLLARVENKGEITPIPDVMIQANS